MNFFLLTLLLGIFFNLQMARADQKEDKIFDSNRTSFANLLLQKFKSSKLLVIGFSFHSHHRHIDQLADLVKKVGFDQKLKYIVLERAQDSSQFHELLSTSKLDKVLSQYEFKNSKAQQEILCIPEFAYTISHFFPLIQKLNEQRPKKNPLLVKAIDGRLSGRDEDWPGEKTITDGTCKAASILMKGIVTTSYGVSSNREEATANNFISQIWQNLGEQEKAIVLYNKGHVLPDFETCQPTMISEDKWVANKGPLTWVERFLKKVPGARKKISIVVIDEKYSEKLDGTTFKFSTRHSERYPGQDWAIDLESYKGEIPEVGMDIFTPSSDFRILFNGNHSGQKTLPELIDGLIWNSKSHLESRNSKAEIYLPLCKNLK